MPSFDAGRTRSLVLATATLTTLALALGGCGGGSSSPSSSSSEAVGGGSAPLASTVSLGRVAGNLHRPYKRRFAHHRKQVLKDVGTAVDTWLDGGFVGVSYPRGSFGTAFRDFTAPAKQQAHHQQSLMTNWALRHRIDGVHVTKRKVTVDVFAPHGRPAGATARVTLVFTTTGHVTKRVALHGRLFLTPDSRGSWRIFGYDVSKGGK